MLTKYFILLFAIIAPVSLYAQEVKAYGYETKSKSDIIEEAKYGVYYVFNQKAVDTQKQSDVILKDTLLLAIGSSHSVFYSPAYYDSFKKWQSNTHFYCLKATSMIDTRPVPLASVKNKKSEAEAYLAVKEGEPLFVYKDREANKLISCIYHFETFKLEEKGYMPKAWKISGEQSEPILGHQCQKAEIEYGGRRYRAWYTVEIPINEGPWKFYGLPGLILKIEEESGVFMYEAIDIENIGADSYITMASNLERLKSKQFNKAADKIREEHRGTIINNGEVIFTISKPYVYNPLELK